MQSPDSSYPYYLMELTNGFLVRHSNGHMRRGPLCYLVACSLAPSNDDRALTLKQPYSPSQLRIGRCHHAANY